MATPRRKRSHYVLFMGCAQTRVYQRVKKSQAWVSTRIVKAISAVLELLKSAY